MSADNELWANACGNNSQGPMCSWGLHFLYFFFLFSGCFLSRMFHSLMQVRHHVINGYVPTVNSWSNLLCSNGCKILHRFTHHRKTGAFYRMLLTSSDNPLPIDSWKSVSDLKPIFTFYLCSITCRTCALLMPKSIYSQVRSGAELQARTRERPLARRLPV